MTSEDGKSEKETTGLQISDKLFKGAIKFVMNKHLSDIGFWKNISSLREKSKSQLQALQHHPNVAKKENVEHQTMLSELNQNVTDLKSEFSQTSQTVSDLRSDLGQSNQMVSELKLELSQSSQVVSGLKSELTQTTELLLEVLKNQKCFMEKQQSNSDAK